MGLLGEFKEFIVKGNAMDMAVGIIIGGVFTPVVGSLVADIIMPPIGFLIGGVDFSSLSIQIAPAVAKGETHPIWQTTVSKDLPAVVISYGKFINTVIALLITGFAVFLLVKGMNKLRRKPDPAPATPPAPPEDVKLLTEIRDLLAKQ